MMLPEGGIVVGLLNKDLSYREAFVLHPFCA